MTVIGISWIQASAWYVAPPGVGTPMRARSIAWPLGAVLALLALFQLVLRPGIRFF